MKDLGLSAEVRLRLGDDVVTWPATIDRISDGIDQRSGTVGVVVVVENAYQQSDRGRRPPLTKGMFVDVVLKAIPIDGVVVPRSAVRDGYVFVADDDNRLRMIKANPLFEQGEIALFSDTITEGMRVVLAPPSPVIEGQLLDLHPDPTLVTRLLAGDAAQ
jgi:multidrug efflux pump subunit AcrA (membrane-fusion protein)